MKDFRGYKALELPVVKSGVGKSYALLLRPLALEKRSDAEFSAELNASLKRAAMAAFNRGKIAEMDFRFGDAIDKYQRAITLDPENEEYKKQYERLNMEIQNIRHNNMYGQK